MLNVEAAERGTMTRALGDPPVVLGDQIGLKALGVSGKV